MPEAIKGAKDLERDRTHEWERELERARERVRKGQAPELRACVRTQKWDGGEREREGETENFVPGAMVCLWAAESPPQAGRAGAVSANARLSGP
jgi:hypothetical protein